MTNKYNRSQSKIRKGNITLLTAAMSVLLMGIVALVTDVGSLYYDHAKLQTATNAAWKAGFDKLAEIRKTKSQLTPEDELTIKNHMIEVMAANGFSNLSEEQLRILLTQNQTNLSIEANDEAKLFFIKLFNVQKAPIAASRSGGSDDAYSIMPIAIPHGEVHDLSVRTYDYIPFDGDQGFASGTEYILKLGGDENADPLGKSKCMVFIPTGLDGRKQATDAKTMLAYGAVFWALQIDETDKDALVPAYWLLNYRGGGFLLKYSKTFTDRLEAEYGLYDKSGYFLVDAEEIANLLTYVEVNIDKTQVSDYLTGLTKGVYTNELIVPLEKRPQIAIYSSQSSLDPVEQILVAAKIPYGTYALPNTSSNSNGWRRNEYYAQNRNTKIFDLEILNGELDKYDWIHLHHEDFTGLTKSDGSSYNSTAPTKCTKAKKSCPKTYAIGYSKKSGNVSTALSNLTRSMCTECKKQVEYSSVKVGKEYKVTLTGWKQDIEVLEENCLYYVYRCGTCGTFDENNWSNQTNFSGCKFYNYLNEHYGYTDDEEFPEAFTIYDLNLSPADLCAKWFSKATVYQKMKWAVAEKIKEHILKGGFMYTQCFAAETLDLALQQSAYHKTKNLTDSYENCLAFQNFTYKQLPKKNGYSSIDNMVGGVSTIPNEYLCSAFCQTTGKPNTGTGATSAFNVSFIKDGIDIMALYSSDICKYLGGQLRNSQGELKGHFCLLGGHNADNLNAKRLVLNNILYGSTSDKETSVGSHYVGRTKYQFGCVDLDNDGERSSADYSKYMLYGFDSPVNFADIISSDNGLYTNETKSNLKLITGDKLATYTPNTIVIVPIVGVPDSVQSYQKEVANNANTSSDQEIETGDYTIYDLKVGGQNFGAAGYDDLESKYSPSDVYIEGLKNSVQVIGFAKFQLKAEDQYNRSDVLGDPLEGQIRGDFIEYIVDPNETAELLQQYNLGYR